VNREQHYQAELQEAQSKDGTKAALVEALKRHNSLEHPVFARLLHSGGMEMKLLRLLGIQGHHLVRAFLGYIAGLCHHCPDHGLRKLLAANFYEEMTGGLSKTMGHLELLEQFLWAIGLTPEQLAESRALPATEALIGYRQDLVLDPRRFHMGAAAVTIASEGQNLESKVGQNRFTLFPTSLGLTERDLMFFKVHVVEDVKHVCDGLEIVAKVCTTDRQRSEAVEAVDRTCALFADYYTGILKEFERTEMAQA
jgi:pyrroloquinoline-quinone synthase